MIVHWEKQKQKQKQKENKKKFKTYERNTRKNYHFRLEKSCMCCINPYPMSTITMVKLALSPTAKIENRNSKESPFGEM